MSHVKELRIRLTENRRTKSTPKKTQKRDNFDMLIVAGSTLSLDFPATYPRIAPSSALFNFQFHFSIYADKEKQPRARTKG
mgnify:CR=1 FL=1